MSEQGLEQNRAASAGILIYAVVLTAAGIGVVVAGVVLHASLAGFLIGGILTVAGGGMLVSKLRGGLAYVTVTCPRCQQQQTYAEEALAAGRVVPCKGCFEYMERGPSGVAAVPEDRVGPEPVFEAPLPDGCGFANACVLCGAAATQGEKISGSVRKAGVGATQRITRTLEVPVCAAHAGQRAAALGPGEYFDGLDGFALRFRSYATRQRFRAENPAPMKVSAASVTFGRGA